MTLQPSTAAHASPSSSGGDVAVLSVSSSAGLPFPFEGKGEKRQLSGVLLIATHTMVFDLRNVSGVTKTRSNKASVPSCCVIVSQWSNHPPYTELPCSSRLHSPLQPVSSHHQPIAPSSPPSSLSPSWRCRVPSCS